MKRSEDEGRQDHRGSDSFSVEQLLYSYQTSGVSYKGGDFVAMLNDCNFIGRVGKPPEFQKPEKGNPYLRFSLAVDQGKDQKGKEKEVMWLQIVCFGKLAELMAGKLEQGIQVFVKGRLQLSTYTKDGVERQSVALQATDIQILEKRQAGSQEPAEAVS